MYDVCPELDEAEILIMSFSQGNVFWCRCDESKFPGQF